MHLMLAHATGYKESAYMTTINRLVANSSIAPNDSFPLWDAANGRTRRITGETLLSFVENKNIKEATINSEDHLIITLNDGSVVDAGVLPKSVLSVDDVQTDTLITGDGVRSSNIGGVTTISQDVTHDIWQVKKVYSEDSPFVITEQSQSGYEYVCDYRSIDSPLIVINLTEILDDNSQIRVSLLNTTVKSNLVQVIGAGFNWYFNTPTLLAVREGAWRVEESSQLLHIQNSTTFSDDEARKSIVHGVAADPDSSITMEVNDDGVLIVGGGDSEDVDLSNYARKDEENTFTANQIIDNAYLEVKGADGDPVFEVSPIDPSVTSNAPVSVNETLTADKVHTTIIDSPNSDLNLKTFGSTAINIGSQAVQFNKGLVANVEVSFNGDAVYYGDTTKSKNLMTKEAVEALIPDDNGGGDSNWQLVNKVSYESSTVNTESTGQGTIHEFLGTGSSSAIHSHEFNDSGVVWVSNFQIASMRDKTVNIGTSVGDVAITSFKIPVNMIARFSYAKDTNKMYSEVSYIRPEFISNNSAYDGDGFGIPGKVLVETGTVVQTKITGNYRNNSDAVGDLTINLRTDEGIKNWRFYYAIPKGSISARKIYVKVDEKAGTVKTINSGEVWQCEIKAGQFFDEFFWSKVLDSASTLVLEEDFNAKSGYNRVHNGGGSTYRIEYIENGSIFKISHSKVEVHLLEGMDETKPHGYFKYINSRNGAVEFEWYDRNGSLIQNATVPTSCPVNTSLEVFADYEKNEYFLTVSASKVINTFEEIDTSSFDVDNPDIKPLLKRFTNTDLIDIPLVLPDGFSIIVRQVMVKRSSGVELEMGFTYRHQDGMLKVHLNEVGTGIILAGIIKNEI